MKIIVDTASRLGKMRAHTATHLLHYQLDTLLKGTKQAGSLVDTDILRFDFSTTRPLESNELRSIETIINQQITQGLAVSIRESSLQEAKAAGAKAFFEDKYGDTVRVVSIQGTHLTSVELCGGIHVPNTSHIGAFLIVSQEAVSSGVRRITAITGPKVAEYAQELLQQRDDLAVLADTQPSQLTQKISKLIDQWNEQNSQIEALNAQVALSYLNQSFPKNNRIDRIIYTKDSPLATLPWKELVSIVKSQDYSGSRLLYSQEGNYALSHPEARTIAKDTGLKGGGAQDFVQGRDEKVITLL